jgi:6-phosphogluconolactonase
MQYASARPLFLGSVVCAVFSALIAAGQTTLPAAKFLYSTDNAGGKIHGYLVNPTTGAIKPNGQNPPWAHWAPTRAVADKGGYRLYVINTGSKDIDAYFINRTNGHLSKVPGAPFAIGRKPLDVRVHPSGHFVYVTAESNWVYAFHVQSNGSLAAVAGSPFSTVTQPWTLAIDPQGKYLYVSSYPSTSTPGQSEVDAFSISSTDGALTPVPGSPYIEPNSQRCANGAWDIAIHPSGNFLILPNMCEGLVVYRIGRTTGSLTLISGSPFVPPVGGFTSIGNVDSIAMDPRGKYFWVSTQYCQSGCYQTTDTWTLNTTTGVPTYLESGESGCGLLTRADPSGKFLYVIGDTLGNGCAGSNLTPAIWGMSVNRTNGGVKNVSGSPWASPNSDAFWSDGLAITP